VVHFAQANGFAVVAVHARWHGRADQGPRFGRPERFPCDHAVPTSTPPRPHFLRAGPRAHHNLPFPLWHISGLDNYSIPHPMFVKKSDYAKAHGIGRRTVVSHATTGSGPSASFPGQRHARGLLRRNGPHRRRPEPRTVRVFGHRPGRPDHLFQNVGQTNNVPITLLSTDGTSTSCVDSSAGGAATTPNRRWT
jgi:hypothetical protein